MIDFAKSASDGLVDEIVRTESARIVVNMGECRPEGCASVRAGDLVEVSARCLREHDKHCGNEAAFYPPLTKIEGAMVHFAQRDRFEGEGLGLTWDNDVRSSAYLGTFVR